MTRIQLLIPEPISVSHVPLKRYDQVLYIPAHLHTLLLEKKPISMGYPNSAQPGFVSSGPTDEGDYYVRYWQIGSDGKVIPDLRTKANSELTPANCLFRWISVQDDDIHKMERHL
ncbi:MAG: hypothetical protein ACW987_15535 [Candidatus Thorarchaeota archaeon]|jgi:hypothetical protein